ncbi:LADA_0E03576g1_1 [Lachancea dasiensis]|uniref:LADA_0E03576g1_1 n=1 Tax=Lachancea dasiensis TaxID=1072105 RepID=A0A1G4JBM6_9SACH|nr:LADA_0E03576g1_1 [Lachancea dasiensis]
MPIVELWLLCQGREGKVFSHPTVSSVSLFPPCFPLVSSAKCCQLARYRQVTETHTPVQIFCSPYPGCLGLTRTVRSTAVLLPVNSDIARRRTWYGASGARPSVSMESDDSTCPARDMQHASVDRREPFSALRAPDPRTIARCFWPHPTLSSVLAHNAVFLGQRISFLPITPRSTPSVAVIWCHAWHMLCSSRATVLVSSQWVLIITTASWAKLAAHVGIYMSFGVTHLHAYGCRNTRRGRLSPVSRAVNAHHASATRAVPQTPQESLSGSPAQSMHKSG